MVIEVYKKPKESTASLVKRFNQRVLGSGLIIEVKKRMFYQKKENKRARRERALYREKKKKEYEEKKRKNLF